MFKGSFSSKIFKFAKFKKKKPPTRSQANQKLIHKSLSTGKNTYVKKIDHFYKRAERQYVISEGAVSLIDLHTFAFDRIAHTYIHIFAYYYLHNNFDITLVIPFIFFGFSVVNLYLCAIDPSSSNAPACRRTEAS